MKKSILSLLCLWFSVGLWAQEYQVSGTVTDADLEEPLLGVAVTVETTDGTLGAYTDIDGAYALTLKNGDYKIRFSYVGFEDQLKDISINGNDETLDVVMGSSVETVELEVFADIAIGRKTPVAFSNITTEQIQEELASQDLPMLLNSTPGVYATQQGGGDGDSRINIRGFKQNNVAVMLDGIPVNDMENGAVYWSNWFGLDVVTKTMQVQRGLGASKLSIPAIGGTINILTKGINEEQSFRFKQEYGSGHLSRTTVGYNSGRLKGNFGISAAASYKKGSGWVDGNYTEGAFYYLRVDKQFGKHMLSLTGFGAPQKHGQRPYTAETWRVDSAYARNTLGITADEMEVIRDGADFFNKGRRFNEEWGFRDGKTFNMRENFYHKPQINLRHFWQINNNLALSSVAYLSIGKGAGTAPEGADAPRVNGALDIDSLVRLNQTGNFARPAGKAESVIRASHNEHFWYGLLSTMEWDISEDLKTSFGVDLRAYEGMHYRTYHDLLGADYAGRNILANNRRGKDARYLQGDRVDYDYTGFVQWGGLFALAEYSKKNLSAFFNVSAASTAYSATDYMKDRVFEAGDQTILVGIDDTITHEGNRYHFNSPEVKDQRVDWIVLPTFTIKTGASYRFNRNISGYANLGYYNKAPKFNSVINSNRFEDRLQTFNEHPNEEIYAFELGSSMNFQSISANFNAYYTHWNNKPLASPPTVPADPEDPESDRINVNIPGINARHMGLELDLKYRPSKAWDLDAFVSVGDWIWNSKGRAELTVSTDSTEIYEFDATGIHIGDAAQSQFGFAARYAPQFKIAKGAYVKVRGTYFGRNYADFNPESRQGVDARREAWQMPDYFLLDLHAGYRYKINKDWAATLRLSVFNLLDTLYVSDADDNSNFNSPAFADFDAKSSAVFYGLGRRFNISLIISMN